MPTRKQRRRAAKEKRHEYETVWVDAEGNELDEPPEEAPDAARDERRNGAAKSQPAQKPKTQQRGGRTVRTPPAPSWQRAAKRSLLLGAVGFVLFYLGGRSGGSRLPSAIGLAAIYTALFIPFTYAIDRFTYQRWQRKQGGGQPPSPRKR